MRTTDELSIKKQLDHCITTTSHPKLKKTQGKVRDIYQDENKLLLVTTDRLSAFDRVLTAIPFKGQILNQLSKWWFDKTSHLIPNHVLDMPYSNALLVNKVTVFPVEFVVRGYITGNTNTALWTLYQNGERTLYGHHLPDGLNKHQRLNNPMITPTTKSTTHDAPISAKEIIAQGLMTADEWEQASTLALNLFTFGQKQVEQGDLILVDTKYEMGKDEQGNIILIDEIHTPDSSRYWRKSNYQARLNAGRDPDNFDKDTIRSWYKNACNPYQDDPLPQAPDELRIQLATTYLELFKNITGKPLSFELPCFGEKDASILCSATWV